jgi:hypothetical protein
MDETPSTELNDDEQESTPAEAAESVSRRDFLKLAAILTGSTLLLLSRCGGLEVPGEVPGQVTPPIPPNFKRFILVKREQRAMEVVQVVVAFGSQCPDWQCALLWINDPDFQFYDNVEEIINLYTQDGQTELMWLD